MWKDAGSKPLRCCFFNGPQLTLSRIRFVFVYKQNNRTKNETELSFFEQSFTTSLTKYFRLYSSSPVAQNVAVLWQIIFQIQHDAIGSIEKGDSLLAAEASGKGELRSFLDLKVRTT